ncbi:unnamed protein product [Closterium sp. NIES-54]
MVLAVANKVRPFTRDGNPGQNDRVSRAEVECVCALLSTLVLKYGTISYTQLVLAGCCRQGSRQQICASPLSPRALCCSVLLCAALCCSVLPCAALCCPVLLCAALCCSVLPSAALCCSVLLCAALCCSVLPCAALCCPVLPCAALCCLLPCAALCFPVPCAAMCAALCAPAWQTYDAAVGDITVLDSRSKFVFFTYPIQVWYHLLPDWAVGANLCEVGACGVRARG